MSFPFRSIHCLFGQCERCQDGAARSCACSCHRESRAERLKRAEKRSA